MRTNLKLTPSILVLIIANCVPLIGAVYFAWDAGLVLALFWIENLIIGLINVIKITWVVLRSRRYANLFLVVFFVLHYGLFCSLHGSLLWDLLNLGSLRALDTSGMPNIIFLELFLDGATVFTNFVELYSPIIWLGIFSLFASQLISFIEGFILNGKVFSQKANSLMSEPYAQILVMHVGLIVGAMVLEELGSPLWLLLLIVVFKIVVDVVQHLKLKTKV